MTLLPAPFGRPWSCTLGLASWRTEIRQQGHDARPSVPCRLMHFHSPLSACQEAATRAAWQQHGVAHLRGFITDPPWTAASRRNRPKGEQGTVTPGAPASLSWRIEVSDGAEFEALWCMVRRAENPGTRLSMFLYGEAATSHEGDRGEIMQEASITSYRLILDHGDFPEP